jgi:hypothetical protein
MSCVIKKKNIYIKKYQRKQLFLSGPLTVSTNRCYYAQLQQCNTRDNLRALRNAFIVCGNSGGQKELSDRKEYQTRA